MELVREGMAAHGQVFFAHAQTQGRGQRGRQWWSAAGENIQLSIVLEPRQLAASHTFRLIAAVALGVAHFVEHHTHPGWKIKWPNDIYWGDRKAGGILIENVFQSGQWRWAIAGVGINVNSTHFDPGLPNPTSMALVSGRRYHTEELGQSLCQFVQQRWLQLLEPGGWPQILAEYNRLLYGAGQQHRLKQQNSVGLYPIKRVNEQGLLIAGSLDEYQFEFGQVEWVLPVAPAL
ncbi:MAG: biotin--[acetyl-CoA-carboxylase] ligase [Chitinophagaceae bacterium]|nr:biotin--[acetyl-CoA-carboxylase] ligase [Chitinophagaceae bacterium]